MRAERIALGAAILFVTIAMFGIGVAQRRSDLEAASDRRVTLVARSIAYFVAQSEGELQPTIEAAQRAVEAETIMVLKGAKILAHGDLQKAGQKLDPESLTDKAIFDAGARMKALVSKQGDQGVGQPSLELDPRGVWVPAERDGTFVGAVRVELPRTGEASFSLSVLLIGLLCLVTVASPLRGRAQLALGTVAVVIAAMADVRALADWREDLRRQTLKAEAGVILSLGEAGLLGKLAPGTQDGLASALDRDDRGAPRQELLAVRSATIGASAIGDGLSERRGDYEVVHDGAALVRAKAEDLQNLGLWAAAIAAFAVGLYWLGALGRLASAVSSVYGHRWAYAYLTPAGVGMGVLVVIPMLFGIVLGFLERRYNVFEFVGLANFVSILSDFSLGPQSFYFKLGVTALWTTSNVVLHLSIGLFLALLLNDQLLKAKGIFRVLLIVPWAVPNYITALIWKGMFHKQFGAVNFFLESLGVEPLSWFQGFWPAFFTNLATNTWLGFPFMMVVSLGALQSIPTDLYEAAFVDGASRFQRFSKITLPLLLPALVPAVIVGTVWTFNMFNIIYLVSAGAPDGATDILVTDAYRWAFERDRYGYAAAYSTLIFGILLTFTLITNRLTGATKGAFE